MKVARSSFVPPSRAFFSRCLPPVLLGLLDVLDGPGFPALFHALSERLPQFVSDVQGLFLPRLRAAVVEDVDVVVAVEDDVVVAVLA